VSGEVQIQVLAPSWCTVYGLPPHFSGYPGIF
jgi:hypothetical protein